MSVLAVIPARYASTRFPGKPLALIQGKSMIQRVWEQVAQVSLVHRAVVATDDERIAEHVLDFGGTVCMTRADHPSGTDRCAEVAAQVVDCDWIVNIQGDEPFVQPEQINLLIETLIQSKAGIATLVKKISDPALLFNPNVVKAVRSQQGQAIYFSRHPIPFLRGYPESEWLQHADYFKHIGLYGFARNTLLQLAELPPTPLEIAESLEQLRWLQHGYAIQVGITHLETVGIDTPEDLERVNGV
jgi:3-deoxy-manno-octulosonate cytidylyltransferase (CMP-KDO synthetase)